MQDILGESLKQLNKIHIRRRRIIAIVLVLSLIVSLDVFWVLRQPGLTLAGNADCGITEHIHQDACLAEGCTQKAHVHTVDCYSDETADVETQIHWQKLFADFPYTGDLAVDLVGIAQTQVGYTESSKNFQMSDDGKRQGYTRYGAWYGAPYNDWSAMFVSFCLHYAGANPEQFPGNIGANSMANLWKILGKYASAKGYTPAPGDLVFFANNTVGIVAETGISTFNVIRGDMDGKVQNTVMPIADDTIAGWGLTNKAPPENPLDNELLDISNGPAVFIFTGGDSPQPRAMRFALRNTARTTGQVNDLIAYLNSKNGSYSFALVDTNNQELPKDANGNYIAQPDTSYKLTLTFNSKDGFPPGSYEYQIPNGLLVSGGEGEFILNETINAGSWVVTDEGLITLTFNEQMNTHTDVTISATVGIMFPNQDDPLDFDGKITVTIEKPPEEEKPVTKVNKWGSQGVEGAGTKNDPTKIYWTVLITGVEGSQIPGSTITDNVIVDPYLGEHMYTESDIANGLSIGVSEFDPITGTYINWHAWHVSPDDPNLYWDKYGWSYAMPEVAHCQWCGELVLDNPGWEYYIEYSSTPALTSIPGALSYMNHVTVDNQGVDGWAEFAQGEIHADINKTGTFQSDAAGGKFQWEIQTVIPGMQAGQKAQYHWYIMDYMDIRNPDFALLGYVENTAHKATVTASYNGRTITVPRIEDATEDDPFAWEAYWKTHYGNDIYSVWQINIVCRCHCNEDNCQFWSGHCESEYWFEADDGLWYTNGYCQCWTETENTVFTLTYDTDDLTTIENFGGAGNMLRNEAHLYNKVILPNGSIGGIDVADSQASVTIPGLFHKNLTHDFDGYTANYKITVNEAKLVLTDGTPLKIHDVMTETLAFISGSLVITSEDRVGHTATLQQDVDYTVTYDGTGGQVDKNGKPVHVLDIVIHNPQPVMYTLDYDTTLIIPTGTTTAVKYNNDATITLWGQDITDTTVEKVYTNINIAAKSYRVEMVKTSSLTGEHLKGALFGLYNEHGGLITTEETDHNGELNFKTDIIQGIILREHVLYYMQELRAPPGYQLDETKYWFCFCDSLNNACEICNEVMAGTNAFRIPNTQIGRVEITNDLLSYNLPGTGGPGIYPLILASVICIITPLVYGFIRRRKRERRGVG